MPIPYPLPFILGELQFVAARLQTALFSGAGVEVETGAVAALLAAVIASLTGAEVETGTAAPQVAAATFAGSGATIFAANIAATAPAVTAEAAGVEAETGTVAASLTAATTALAGFEHPRGALTATLTCSTTWLSGGVETGLDVIIGPVTTALSGFMVPEGTITATLIATTLTATAQTVFQGQIHVLLKPAWVSSSGYEHGRGAIHVAMRNATTHLVGIDFDSGMISPQLRPAVVNWMRGFIPQPGVNVIDFGETLSFQCDAIWHYTRELRRVDDSLRKDQPLLRYWNAEWELKFIGGIEYKASFTWISNDTGPGQCEIPFNTPLAQWIHDSDGRMARGEGRNVCITVDYCGARWSGLMDRYAVEQREDGDVVLVVDWMHDYEHL